MAQTPQKMGSRAMAQTPKKRRSRAMAQTQLCTAHFHMEMPVHTVLEATIN